MERIRFVRNLRGMTQKVLGTAVGFFEKTADIRMAQYESGSRSPKADLTNALAGVLDISPLALNVPDIDSYLGLMHTLFAVEDIYGLKVDTVDDEVCLKLDKNSVREYDAVHQMFFAWAEQSAKYRSGEIIKEQYEQWRYRYPEFDTTQRLAKVPSQELSDALVEQFKNRQK